MVLPLHGPWRQVPGVGTTSGFWGSPVISPRPAVGSLPRPEMACWRPRPLPSTSGLKSESKNQRDDSVQKPVQIQSGPVFPGGVLKVSLSLSSWSTRDPPQGLGAPLGLVRRLCSALGFCLQGWEGGTAREARSPGSQHESDLAE